MAEKHFRYDKGILQHDINHGIDVNVKYLKHIVHVIGIIRNNYPD
jgi:hypothetical protein